MKTRRDVAPAKMDAISPNGERRELLFTGPAGTATVDLLVVPAADWPDNPAAQAAQESGWHLLALGTFVLAVRLSC